MSQSDKQNYIFFLETLSKQVAATLEILAKHYNDETPLRPTKQNEEKSFK